MSIIGIGIDLVDIDRFENISERFLTRVFDPLELDYIKSKKNPLPSLAARFAAKEAVIKAFGWRLFGQSLKEIIVIKEANGPPYIKLIGKADKEAAKAGATKVFLSISHSKTMAIAKVIVLGGDIDEDCLKRADASYR